MTRAEAIEKVKLYLMKVEYVPRFVADGAFDGDTPMRGSLLMLEALGLVKFDDTPDDPPAS